MNRTIPPPSRSISHFDIIRAETVNLSNGIDLHLVNSGTHDILQLEIILRSGKWFEKVNGESFFTARMLTEGTNTMSSRQISEFFETYGVQFKAIPGIDLVTLSAVMLNKHFDKILPVIAECLFDPVFPVDELETLKELEKQELKVSQEKGSYISLKEFRKMVYGGRHPYGRSLEIGEINGGINPELLRKFHSTCLLNGMEIILTGKLNQTYIDKVNAVFGNRILTSSGATNGEVSISPFPENRKDVLKPGSLQTSVRYGKRSIGKTHPDFPGLMVANELLGGFFGSRLMKNIREEKGYTYGIYSGIVNYLNDSFFVISADLVREHTENAILEINKEINRLQTEEVKADELDTVKNYMLGSFLSSLETSFSHAEKFKAIHYFGQGYDFYDRYIETIKNITPSEIASLANRYFSTGEFSLVTVGDKG